MQSTILPVLSPMNAGWRGPWAISIGALVRNYSLEPRVGFLGLDKAGLIGVLVGDRLDLVLVRGLGREINIFACFHEPSQVMDPRGSREYLATDGLKSWFFSTSEHALA